MFNNLFKRLKRNRIIAMIFFLVLCGICLAITRFNIIKVINGPEKVNLVKNDIKDYQNEYIQVSVYHPLEMYEEDYVKNTDTNTTRTTHYGYIVMDANETYTDYKLYGIMVPDEYEATIYNLAEESYSFLASSELLPTYEPFVIKGTVMKMDSTALGFYNESLESLELDPVSEAYYINYNQLPGEMDISFVIGFTAFAGIFLVVAIIMLVFALSNSGLKKIEKYVAKNPGKSVEQLDAEFQTAKCFAKSIWVTKDHIFTTSAFSIKIIDLKDVVWAYYYRRTGRHAQSYVRMYNTKKRMLYVNAPQNVSQDILAYLDQVTTHMVLGYDRELEQMFNKNFNEFLNLRYNAPTSETDELFQ